MWKLLLLLIGAETVAAVAAQSVCDWSRKHDGHGDSEDEEGTFPTDTECVQHCEEKKKTKPEINGATVRKSDRMCWCEIWMNKKEADDKYDTCYLKVKDVAATTIHGQCSNPLNEAQCREVARHEGKEFGWAMDLGLWNPPYCVYDTSQDSYHFNTNRKSRGTCSNAYRCACHKGQWTPWKAWGECSKTCGVGEQKRSRECLDSKGGASTACDGGDAEEVQACNVDECTDTCAPTLGGTSGGSCCTFPFTYQGHTHHKCTDEGWHTFWCATTENYDTDGKWGECDLDDSCLATEGGNTDPGHPCHFPFTYRGEQVTSCIKTRHHRLWCATTGNYDTDWKWGNCLPQTTPCDHEH